MRIIKITINSDDASILPFVCFISMNFVPYLFTVRLHFFIYIFYWGKLVHRPHSTPLENLFLFFSQQEKYWHPNTAEYKLNVHRTKIGDQYNSAIYIFFKLWRRIEMPCNSIVTIFCKLRVVLPSRNLCSMILSLYSTHPNREIYG